MAYDIFTQPQGANINTSLFPQAASAGINAGNAMKTPLQAGIEGAIQGIQTGQSIVRNQQIINADAAQQEQIRISNERQQIALQRDKELEQLQTGSDRAKLQDETIKYSQDAALRQKQDEFQKAFAAADPLQQKQLVFSGQYADVFANDPNVYKQSVATLYPNLSPSEREAAGYNGQRYGTQNYYDKQRQINANKYSLLSSELAANDIIQNTASRSNLTPEQVPEKVEIAPSGKYARDPNTHKILFDDKTGRRKISEDYDPTSKPQTYEFIHQGQIVQEGVTPDLAGKINTARGLKGYVDGSYQNRAMAGITNNQKAQQQQTQRQEQVQQDSNFAPEKPGYVAESPDAVKPNPNALANIPGTPLLTKSGQLNLSDNPKAYEVARSTVGLKTEDFDKIKPEFKNIFETIEQGRQGTAGTFSKDQLTTLDSSKESIAKYLSKREFETNPKLKKVYNSLSVQAHNAQVEQAWELINNPLKSMFTSSNAAELLKTFGGNLSPNQLVEVDSPEELYALKSQSRHNELLNVMINRYEQSTRAALKAKDNNFGVSGKLLNSLNTPG